MQTHRAFSDSSENAELASWTWSIHLVYNATNDQEIPAAYVPVAQAVSVSRRRTPLGVVDGVADRLPSDVASLPSLAAPWQKLIFIAGSPMLSFLAYSLLHDVSPELDARAAISTWLEQAG